MAHMEGALIHTVMNFIRFYPFFSSLDFELLDISLPLSFNPEHSWIYPELCPIG